MYAWYYIFLSAYMTVDMYLCAWLYTVWVPSSAEFWLVNTNTAMENMLVVITQLF